MMEVGTEEQTEGVEQVRLRGANNESDLNSKWKIGDEIPGMKQRKLD